MNVNASACSLAVPGGHVSRVHAKLARQPGLWRLTFDASECPRSQRRRGDARDRRPASVTAISLALGAHPYAELRAIGAPLFPFSFSRREWVSA